MDRRTAMVAAGAGVLTAAIPGKAAEPLVRVTADVFRADVPSTNGNVYPLRVLKGVPPLLKGAKVMNGRNDDRVIGRVESAICTDDGWVVAFADVPPGVAAGLATGELRLMPNSRCLLTGSVNSAGGMDIQQVQEIHLFACPASEASWPR